MTLDDGADLVATVHRDRTDLLQDVVGGMEETTTGVIRLKQHGRRRQAPVPHNQRQ